MVNLYVKEWMREERGQIYGTIKKTVLLYSYAPTLACLYKVKVGLKLAVALSRESKVTFEFVITSATMEPTPPRVPDPFLRNGLKIVKAGPDAAVLT